jgi:hypothetical protein
MHEEVPAAFSLARVIPEAPGFLANSKTIEEYRGRCDAWIAERRLGAAARPLNRIGEPSTDAEIMADAEAAGVELERLRSGGLP